MTLKKGVVTPWSGSCDPLYIFGAHNDIFGTV